MNKYYNHFFFEGPAETISSMYDWIKANDPKSSDYWLDELVKTRGVDTSDFYVKCATIWKYEVDQGVLKILVDSRGGGALEYMWAIEDQFPGSKQGPYVDDRSKPTDYSAVGNAAKGAFGGLVDLIVGLINVIRLLKK